jgi:hypothetical protein
MVVDAYNRRARGGEVVVVGADRPDRTVKRGQSRLNAVIARKGAKVKAITRRTTRRRVQRIPASFTGGFRVVYSLQMGHLKAGDVLLVQARQRTAIKRIRYFISHKVVIATRRTASHPSRLTRRITAPRGAATPSHGFNCTIGPSGFRTPCLTRKAGMLLIKRTPKRPLFVNLRARGFPKVEPTNSPYPPLHILRRGSLTVTRLRATGVE